MLAAAAGPSLIINQGENPGLPPNPSSSPRGKQVRGEISSVPRQIGGQKSGTESSDRRYDSVGRSRSGRIKQSNRGIGRELGDLGLEGEEGEAKEPT